MFSLHQSFVLCPFGFYSYHHHRQHCALSCIRRWSLLVTADPKELQGVSPILVRYRCTRLLYPVLKSRTKVPLCFYTLVVLSILLNLRC
jgi:hypothetical protein